MFHYSLENMQNTFYLILAQSAQTELCVCPLGCLYAFSSLTNENNAENYYMDCILAFWPV